MTIDELKDFIRTCKIGTKLEIATSQYASNTTAPGHRFDCYSNAAAVRSLINAGYLKGSCGWRYYEVKVVKHPPELLKWERSVFGYTISVCGRFEVWPEYQGTTTAQGYAIRDTFNCNVWSGDTQRDLKANAQNIVNRENS